MEAYGHICVSDSISDVCALCDNAGRRIETRQERVSGYSVTNCWKYYSHICLVVHCQEIGTLSCGPRSCLDRKRIAVCDDVLYIRLFYLQQFDG